MNVLGRIFLDSRKDEGVILLDVKEFTFLINEIKKDI